MGRLKPLLSWPDGSGSDVALVEYQVAQLLDAGVDEVVVVVGHRANEVIPHVRGPRSPDDRVKHVVNPRYASGKHYIFIGDISYA